MSLCIIADVRFRLDRREGGWIFPANVDVNALPKVGLAVGKQGEGMGEKMFYITPRDLAYSPSIPGYALHHHLGSLTACFVVSFGSHERGRLSQRG